MVYEKYVKKKGKLHGPYYYESYREDGKVKKRYIGTELPVEKRVVPRSFFVILLVLLAFLIVYGANYSYQNITGKTIFSHAYVAFEKLSEQTYQNTDVPVTSEDSNNNDAVSDEPQTQVEEQNVQVETGIENSNTENEVVNEETVTEDNSGITEETSNSSEEDIIISEENTSPILTNSSSVIPSISLNQSNQTGQTNQSSSNSQINKTEEENVIEETMNQTEIPASTLGNISSFNETVNETLSNETILNETFVEEGNLSLIKDLETLRIAKNGNFELNLSDYFANAESYSLNISNISSIFSGEILILTPDFEFKGARKAMIVAYLGNESLESNEFTILVSSGNIKIETARSEIKLGERVKWKQNVSLDTPENVSVELPKEAENVSVKVVDNGIEKEVEAQVTGVTANVIAEIELEDSGFSLIKWIKNIFRKFTGRAVSDLENSGENKSLEVLLDDDVLEYTIEYETPAPTSTEQETESGKTIVISGPDDLNYTDVLSFTDIKEVYKVGKEDRIRIYWKENGTFVAFDAYDLSDNGYLDYLEWITPHLSNQTFEIILITKAEHLDENRTFVEDVYPAVKERDGNYSLIPAGDYLRITFEKNLTQGKDITIYARTNETENNVSVEVYEINGTEKIMTFEDIYSHNDFEYKLYLTEFNGSQDTFDLLVLGGDVEFDYVVDPNISFVGPTISDQTVTTNRTVIVNVSIIENSLAIKSVKFNWNATNYTIYNDSLILMMNFDAYTRLNDTSLYGNNGTCTNCPTFNTSGKYGGSYVFDGVGNYLNVTDTPDFDLEGEEGLTIAMWLKTNHSAADKYVFSNFNGNDPLYVLFVDNGVIRLTIRSTDGLGSSTITGTNIADGKWHYIVASRDVVVDKVQIYVDGGTVVQDSDGTAGKTIYPSGELRIGAQHNGAGMANFFNGSIDELMVYNRTFSLAEVVENYFINFAKFNATNWGLYVNQSKNATTQLDYGNYTYFACASDSNGENCTETRQVKIMPPSPYLISSCEAVLNESNKQYNLTANIDATGTCLSVRADNVTLDGKGFRVLSLNGVGYGINATNATGPGWNNFTLMNVNVTNFSVDVAGFGANVASGNAWNGGGVAIYNSTTNIVNVSGGSTEDASGAVGGNGGHITLTDSRLQTLTSTGGAAVSPGTGGVGGNVNITNSNLTSVINIGGGALFTTSPGDAGIVIIINSSLTTLNSYGGLGDNLGNGGTITITNSNLTTINAYGGKGGDGSPGLGGTVTITNSNFTNINLTGGDSIGAGAGNTGGVLTIIGSSINLIGKVINLTGGGGNPEGNAGLLTINYSSSLIDTNANYGRNLTLRIINSSNSGGEVRWLNSLNGTAISGRLGTNVSIGNNSVFVDSNTAELNKSANVTLYGIPTTFITPIILKNGVQCSDCWNFTSLNAGTVKFNVTSWSTYSIAEGASYPTCPSSTDGNWIVSSNYALNSSVNCNIINVTNGSTLTVNENNVTLNSSLFYIEKNSVLTHRANAAAQLYIINLTTGNLSVEVGSNISVNGRGYSGNSGGVGSGIGGGFSANQDAAGGAGYGGFGGNGSTGALPPSAGGSPYGDEYLPLQLGSAGGTGDSGSGGAGGAGGGLIALNVTDTLSLNGIINVNGNNGINHASYGGGGGSGGSVYISAGTISGSGNITSNGANGGDGSAAGGGAGGGRIYLSYQSLSFSGRFNAAGGAKGTDSGGVTPGSGGTSGTIGLLNRNTNSLTVYSAWDFYNNVNYTNISAINLTNGRTLNNTSINISDTLQISDSNWAYTNGSNITINLLSLNIENSSFTIFHGIITARTVSLNNGGKLANTNITINTANLTISVDSIINATGRGYSGNSGGIGSGTGGGFSANQDAAGGAGYGGFGGNGSTGALPPSAGGSPYGDEYLPLQLGSAGGTGDSGSGGAGGAGGGLIALNVTDTLSLNGIINVNGNNGINHASYGGGGGSGGSVYISAGTISGSGNITTRGGSGGDGSAAGGGGSGGRIYSSFGSSTFSGSLSAGGGVNGTNSGIPLFFGFGGSAGTLVMNFSGSYNDLVSDYGQNVTLRLINRSAGGGEIRWLQELNGTAIAGRLGTNVSIGNNTAFVDSVSTSALNRSANITFYGIGNRGFAFPVIVRDGTTKCDSTTTPRCYNFTSLTAQDVTFNVSSWSEYEIGEDPGIAPNVLLVSPGNNSNFTTNTIYFIANHSSNTALKNTTLYVWNSTGGLVNTNVTTISGITNSSNLSLSLQYEGRFFWNYLTFDNSGNSAWNATNFTFNYNVNPLVTIVNPLNVSYSTNNLPLIFNVSLNEAGSCNYTLSNGATNLTMTANSSATGFNATNSSIATGSYTFRAYCIDNYGNKNETESVVFSFDITALKLDNIVLQMLNNTDALVTFTANKAVNASVNYGTNPSTLGTLAVNTSFGTSKSVLLSGLTPGTQYYYNITGCTSLGECKEHGPFSFYSVFGTNITVNKSAVPSSIVLQGGNGTTKTEIRINITVNSLPNGTTLNDAGGGGLGSNGNKVYTGVDVIFVTDVSGSMLVQNRLPLAKSASKAFVDLMNSSTDRVGLVSFSTTAILRKSLTNDFASVKTSIDSLVANGWTAIGDGIGRAITEFNQNGNSNHARVAILLADGEQNYGSNPITQAQLAANNNLTIYTIGLGSAINPTMLGQIASITGGKYYSAGSGNDLAQIYNEIKAELGNLTGVEVLDYVIVRDVITPGFTDLGEYSQYPSLINDTSDGRILEWRISNLATNQTREFRFNVSTATLLNTQETNVFALSKFIYNTTIGEGTIVFPRTYVTVQNPLVRFVNSTLAKPGASGIANFQVCNNLSVSTNYSLTASANCAGFGINSISYLSTGLLEAHTSVIDTSKCLDVAVNVSVPGSSGTCNSIRLNVSQVGGNNNGSAYGTLVVGMNITLLRPYNDVIITPGNISFNFSVAYS